MTTRDELTAAIAKAREAIHCPAEFTVPIVGDWVKIGHLMREFRNRVNDRPLCGADRGCLLLLGGRQNRSYPLRESWNVEEKCELVFSLLERSWNASIASRGILTMFPLPRYEEADFTPLFQFDEFKPIRRTTEITDGEFLTVGPSASHPWRGGMTIKDCWILNEPAGNVAVNCRTVDEPKPADPEPPAQSWRDRPPLL